MGKEKYIGYEAGRGERCWMIIEDDGSEDGRIVASDLTEADCARIVTLLNADEERS